MLLQLAVWLDHSVPEWHIKIMKHVLAYHCHCVILCHCHYYCVILYWISFCYMYECQTCDLCKHLYSFVVGWVVFQVNVAVHCRLLQIILEMLWTSLKQRCVRQVKFCKFPLANLFWFVLWIFLLHLFKQNCECIVCPLCEKLHLCCM